MIVFVTNSDCLCDANFNSDWQWFVLSLRVIAFWINITKEITLSDKHNNCPSLKESLLKGNHSQWQAQSLSVTVKITITMTITLSDKHNHCPSLPESLVMVNLKVTYSDMACHWEWLPFNSDSGSDQQWLWLSLRVISSVMVILTVMNSDMACHWEWFPLWWSVTENDYFCDGDCDSDELSLWMSLRVIVIVMVIVTVTGNDCDC